MSKARVLEAERDQLRWDFVDLESQLPLDHRARIVWAFVLQLDLSGFYARIGAREDTAGRPPVDPKIHLSLWLYATLENIGSARAVARACERDAAFRWLCGGVPVNYHGLSDFRVGHGDLLDELLSGSVCALMAEALVDLEEVVQDGTKVRAHASRGSFVDEAGLERFEAAARWRVHRLREELESDPGASQRRGGAARARAAAEMTARAGRARKVLEKLGQEKKQAAKKHRQAEAAKSGPEVSTSDPEARLMKFADGATRPGYNIQLAASGCFIVGLEATDRRNDSGLAEPMVEQLEARYGKRPERLVLDGGIATQDEIAALGGHLEAPVAVFAPVPAERGDIKPENLRRREKARGKEPQALKDWRARMAGKQGAAAMKRRLHIETLNAIVKNRGMGAMLVRGLEKIRACALLQALANNLMQAHRLRAQARPA